VPILAVLVYLVAPPQYFSRMDTIGDTTESSSAGRLDAWVWGWQFALDHPITGGGYHSFLLHQTGTIDNPAYLEAHNIFVETLGDHGFVGLALLLMLVFGMIVNCHSITKRSRKLPDLEWAANLGTMLQLAMWTFLAGSQFLADASQSMPYELCALSLATRGIIERRLAMEPNNILAASAIIANRPAAPAKTALAPSAAARVRPHAVALGRRS
jgi:hypothetical protein